MARFDAWFVLKLYSRKRKRYQVFLGSTLSEGTGAIAQGNKKTRRRQDTYVADPINQSKQVHAGRIVALVRQTVSVVDGLRVKSKPPDTADLQVHLVP